ncbi:lytic murein transglycosylase [Kordiimonas marina]|uniref:lytic murein transglycosylase n=1 Tax=Kordiimonas marina TaxID=2872312 RepID=UPI00248C876A|nr:lytic murein transglycosylase [Kordiimonas marina]MCJ9428870.1 lytic murein transglycosylase [Kordiimonas marina]
MAFGRRVGSICGLALGACLGLSASFTAHAETNGFDTAGFETWLQGVRTEARSRGISDKTIKLALSNVKPVHIVVKRDRNQPELKQTYARYLKSRLSDWRRKKGAEMMASHSDELKTIQKDYGVQGQVVAAIWGIETNYGTVPLSYSVFDAVATLAYDKRRGPRFRRELFAALEILDKGYAPYDEMKGSWAGAMGQPQFMPENYLKYAVDQDGDGKRDIWASSEDVFASIANFLKSNGYRSDEIWGRKVKLPKGGEQTLQGTQAAGLTPPAVCARYKSLGIWRNLQDWQALGVRRTNGADLPTRSIPAALVVGDEGDGEGYLVYGNFCSIMRYNPSFKYALAVGMLSDIIKD